MESRVPAEQPSVSMGQDGDSTTCSGTAGTEPLSKPKLRTVLLTSREQTSGSIHGIFSKARSPAPVPTLQLAMPHLGLKSGDLSERAESATNQERAKKLASATLTISD